MNCKMFWLLLSFTSNLFKNFCDFVFYHTASFYRARLSYSTRYEFQIPEDEYEYEDEDEPKDERNSRPAPRTPHRAPRLTFRVINCDDFCQTFL
jgi:hypothetical protein